MMPFGSVAAGTSTILVAAAVVLSGSAIAASDDRPIFSWDVKNGLTDPWRMIGGKWEMRKAGLQQFDPGQSARRVR